MEGLAVAIAIISAAVFLGRRGGNLRLGFGGRDEERNVGSIDGPADATARADDWEHEDHDARADADSSGETNADGGDSGDGGGDGDGGDDGGSDD